MKRSMWTFSILFVFGVATALAQPPAGTDSPPGGQGRGPGAPGGGRPPSPVIEALDTDRDSVISVEELKNAATSLVTLDKNKDGKLTDDEYRPQGGRPGSGGAPGGPGGGGQRGPGGPGGGQGMNLNPERMLTHALEFDEDKDGKLGKEELEKFIADFVKRHGSGGAGASGGTGGPPRSAAGGPSNGPGGGRPDEGERSERPRRPE